MNRRKTWKILKVVLINFLVIELVLRGLVHFSLFPGKIQKFVDYSLKWHTNAKMAMMVNEAATFVKFRPNPESQELNDQGFHSAEIPVEKPDKKDRLAFIGGSTTYNKGPIEETYPHLTAEHLNEKGRNVDYLNAGVSGYTSTGCRAFYHLRVQQFDPDLLVFYNGRNEIMGSGHPYYDHMDLSDKPHPPYVYPPSSLHQTLSSISYLYAFSMEVLGINAFRIDNWNFRSRFGDPPRPEGTLSKTVDEYMKHQRRDDAFKVYRRNVRDLAVLTRSRGTNLLLVGFDFFPEKVSSSSIPDDRELKPKEKAFLGKKLDSLNSILRDVADSYSHVKYFNLDGKIPRKNFKDDCHLDLEGKEHKAELIGDFIDENPAILSPDSLIRSPYAPGDSINSQER